VARLALRAGKLFFGKGRADPTEDSDVRSGVLLERSTLSPHCASVRVWNIHVLQSLSPYLPSSLSLSPSLSVSLRVSEIICPRNFDNRPG